MRRTKDRLYADIETYSSYDVTVVGAAKYAEDVEIILASFAVNDEVVEQWQLGESDKRIKRLLQDPRFKLVAHNAFFERNQLGAVGWCDRPIEDWHCTMAQALAHGLPGKLDMLCRVLGAPEEYQKKKGGTELMRIFSKPQRNGMRIMPEDRPDKWAEYVAYSHQDTPAMRWCHLHMPRINLESFV